MDSRICVATEKAELNGVLMTNSPKLSPWALFRQPKIQNAMKWVPDSIYLKLVYRAQMGCSLNLNNPTTFNEKLQWLKLYDRNPLYTTLVDKAAVKPWVAERIGWEHIVPTLGIWDSFDEIDFNSLPERFVLKCTHDSGGLAICRDRSTFDIAAAKARIERSLAKNYYWLGREWPYKNVKPRILAEEYLDPSQQGSCSSETLSGPDDYKVLCSMGCRNSLRFTEGEVDAIPKILPGQTGLFLM